MTEASKNYRMKSFRLSVTIMSVVCLFVSLSASAEDIGELKYTLKGDQATVTGAVAGTSFSGELVIPASVTYEGKAYTVTEIGNFAFSNYDISSVSIPETVTTIGGGAFQSCTQLVSVTIPKSVITITGAAFQACIGLTSVTIGESVTSIGNNAFNICSKLAEPQLRQALLQVLSLECT